MDEKIVQKFLMLFTLMACWHTDSIPPCDSFPTVTTCQWSCEKVLSVCSHGGMGSRVTNTHDALDLTVQGPLGPGPDPPPRTWDPSPAGNIWWPSLGTCSNLFTSGPPTSKGTDNWNLLKSQVGGTHPTWMLSCFVDLLRLQHHLWRSGKDTKLQPTRRTSTIS